MAGRNALRTAGCLWLVGIACGQARAAEDGPLEVFVAIPPQAYLVERVGGDHVEIHVLLGPGQDPHTFEPAPRQVMALAKARLFFRVGLPLEDRVLEQIGRQHPRLRVVDTAEGIPNRTAAVPGSADHPHGPDGHEAGLGDPHIWLSPPLLKIQAENIARALAQADPAHRELYHENLAALLADLDAVHARVGRLLEPYRGETFYVFHPAFGQFGEAYGLEQEAVEVEGKSPTPKQLRALVKQARAQHVRVLFVRPALDDRNAQAVADAIGAKLVTVNPLARNPLENIDQFAEKLKASLGR